jgi:hypothetical protein
MLEEWEQKSTLMLLDKKGGETLQLKQLPDANPQQSQSNSGGDYDNLFK